MKKSYKNEYKKQRKRIQSAIYRLKKEGFDIPQNILPNIPKNIKKESITRLEKIKPETIRRKSVYIDITTGTPLRWKNKKDKKKITELIKKRKENFYDGVLPVRDIFNDLIDRLSQFPPMLRFFDKSGAVYNVDMFDEIVNPLVEIAKNAYADNDNYITYLETIQFQLFTEIDKILETKYINDTQDRFYRVAQLLNGNTPMSLSDKKSINEYQEMNEMGD